MISSKDTKLGLDLSGGTELIYQGRPTPQNPEVAGRRHRPLDRDHPRPHRLPRRLRARDLADRHRLGPASACRTSRTPSARSARSATPPSSSSTTGSRTSSPTRTCPRIARTESPFPRLYDAVQLASQQEPECFEDTCTTTGPTLLPVRRPDEGADRRPRGRPRRTCSRTERQDQLPPKERQEVVAVPQGTVVVRERAAAGQPRHRREREPGDRQPRLLRDPGPPGALGRRHPQPRGGAPTRPRTSPTSPSSSPTTAGRRSRSVTQEIAERGLANAPPGISATPQRLRALGPLRGRARQRDRLAADHQLRREPGRDRRPHRRPDRGRGQHHRGPGPGRVPEDRRAADRAEADLAVHGLGDPRRGGARPGPEGGHRRPDPGRSSS